MTPEQPIGPHFLLPLVFHFHRPERELAQHIHPRLIVGIDAEHDVRGIDEQLIPGRIDADPLTAVVNLSPGVPAEGVVGVCHAGQLARRQSDERFLDTVRRVGLEPFKERVYAAH